MHSPRALCAATAGICMLMASLAAASPVGLLESIDIEVLQGGQSLFSFQNVSTVGNLNGQDIFLGTANNGTKVWLRVTAAESGNALVEDRWMQMTIRGTDSAGTAAANLFDPLGQGEIEVKYTNMKFSNVDGANGNRVSPFSPAEYVGWTGGGGRLEDLPFFYMLDEYRGFVNLAGSEQYSPNGAGSYNLWDPSIQVPMYVWANSVNPWGYGFQQMDSGHLTGFHLSGIQDFGGDGAAHTGAAALTPVLDPPVSPYFGPTSTPGPGDAGFVSEIGVDLNFRGYTVPEPTTIILLLLPMMMWRRRLS